MSERPIRLTPEQVARLDPFGIRTASASSELRKLLGREERKEQSFRFQKAKEALIRQEEEALEQFFGYEIGVPPLPDEVTPEKFFHWQELKMRLHYLPSAPMGPKIDFPGWKVKPNERFYEAISKGQLPGDSLFLPDKWVLVDSREKPDFLDGIQVYSDDFLWPVIEELRLSGMLKECPTPQTRAYISGKDFDEILRPEIARILRVNLDQVRLPRAIEFNFLGNAYYPQWGETGTFEWIEDIWNKDKQCRTIGGHVRDGGLAYFFWYSYDCGLNDSGFRPLVEFK